MCDHKEKHNLFLLGIKEPFMMCSNCGAVFLGNSGSDKNQNDSSDINQILSIDDKGDVNQTDQ